MDGIGIITLLLIIANGLMTYKGLKDIVFFDKYLFHVDRILADKDYKRLITSGFLHADWVHFAFNMITLYLFSRNLEPLIGIPAFLILYFASLVGGNLLALFIHRNHYDYSAIGASGAVSGLVFASIGLFPGMEIGFLFIPIAIPAWLYGIAYVLYSIYGIKAKRDNIGHEAHLGGGIVGLLIAILLESNIIFYNTFPIALILVPSLFFLFIIVRKPHFLIVSNPFIKAKNVFTVEDRYNTERVKKQSELDRILDKINQQGYDKLTKKEKEKLDELSK